MIKLLRFEYLLNRRPLLVTWAVFTAFFAFASAQIESPRVLVVMLSVMIGLSVPFTILGREDKCKIGTLVCSLPVRRTAVIASRYIAAWAAIGLSLAYALVLMAVLPFSKLAPGDILSLRTLVASLFLISFIFAVLLPFVVRFGMTGVIILLVSTQLLGVLALFLARFIGGKGNPLHVFFRAVEGGLKALLTREPTPGFILAVLGAAVALNAISLAISRALYARKDL